MDQGLPAVNLLNWLIAIAPVAFLLGAMLWLRWSGSKAGAGSWFLAVILSMLFFGANYDVLMSGVTKGLWTTIWILYVIWPAMLLYNVVDKAGGFKRIGKGITALTGSRIMQLFLIGWIFPSFLQGVSGFGAPVAIAAPLLVGLRFPVVIAAAVPLIGHSWAVTFGSMGSSYFATSLTALDNNPPDMHGFAIWGALFLGIACVVTGLAIAFIHGGKKCLIENYGLALIIGMTMGVFLNIMVRIEPAVASFTSGIAGLILGFALSKMSARLHPEHKYESEPGEMSLQTSFAPYFVLIILVLGVTLPPAVKSWANVTMVIQFPFQEVITDFGYLTAASNTAARLRFLRHPGTFLIASSVIGSIIYMWKQHWPRGTWGTALASCVKQTVPGTIAICAMVMMSLLMRESGMTTLLAQGTANATGKLYPCVASSVGALGAFMTGSGTASNVLFSAFQKEIAEIIQVSAWIILGAQTAGGSIGNMICPFNIMLGAATTGSIGKEGEILKRTLPACVIMITLVGIFAWLSVYVYPIFAVGL
jgi:lactate permease